jgi:hypothetical protein
MLEIATAWPSQRLTCRRLSGIQSTVGATELSECHIVSERRAPLNRADCPTRCFSADIAPRRSPVRARLAPSSKLLQMRELLLPIETGVAHISRPAMS